MVSKTTIIRNGMIVHMVANIRSAHFVFEGIEYPVERSDLVMV